jgi:hypothetical protein
MRTANILLHWVLHFPAISRQTGSKGKKKRKKSLAVWKTAKTTFWYARVLFRGGQCKIKKGEVRSLYDSSSSLQNLDRIKRCQRLSVSELVSFFSYLWIFAWSRKWLLPGGSASYKLGRCQLVLGGNRPASYLLLLYCMVWTLFSDSCSPMSNLNRTAIELKI